MVPLLPGPSLVQPAECFQRLSVQDEWVSTDAGNGWHGRNHGQLAIAGSLMTLLAW